MIFMISWTSYCLTCWISSTLLFFINLPKLILLFKRIRVGPLHSYTDSRSIARAPRYRDASASRYRGDMMPQPCSPSSVTPGLRLSATQRLFLIAALRLARRPQGTNGPSQRTNRPTNQTHNFATKREGSNAPNNKSIVKASIAMRNSVTFCI